jgi:hypothetical protein
MISNSNSRGGHALQGSLSGKAGAGGAAAQLQSTQPLQPLASVTHTATAPGATTTTTYTATRQVSVRSESSKPVHKRDNPAEIRVVAS